MALINFNASEVEVTSREPIPRGTYEAVVVGSEIRPTKAGNGSGVNLTFEIVSGEHKGRRVFNWLTISHTNADAQRIGHEQLASLCKAVGVTQLTDTQQLHNIPLMIRVDIDRADPERNVIKRYLPKETATIAPAASSATGTAPWRR